MPPPSPPRSIPPPPSMEQHTWERIEYPSVLCAFSADRAADLHLRPARGERGQPSLALDLILSRRVAPDDAPRRASAPAILSEQEWRAGLPAAGEISALLHTCEGLVVEPEGSFRLGAGKPAGESVEHTGTVTFPCQPNRLDEAWIELRWPGQLTWVEIPYGFVRSPHEPLPPAVAGGPPRFAPAMRPRTGYIARWDQVLYSLGLTDDRKRIALEHSNTMSAHSNVLVTGEGQPAGGPVSERARTRLWFKALDSYAIEATSLGSNYRPAARTRVEMHSWPAYGGEGRGWGRLSVEIGVERRTLLLPTSLMRLHHGHSSGEP